MKKGQSRKKLIDVEVEIKFKVDYNNLLPECLVVTRQPMSMLTLYPQFIT